jgi:hypothetical protein
MGVCFVVCTVLQTWVWVVFFITSSPSLSSSLLFIFSPGSPGHEREALDERYSTGWSGWRKLTPTCDCTPTNYRTSVLMRQTPWSYVAPFTVSPSRRDHQIPPEIHHREWSVHGVLLFGRSGATYDHKSGLIRTGVLQLVEVQSDMRKRDLHPSPVPAWIVACPLSLGPGS